MTYTRNEGIVQSGGSIAATNIAVGRKATISQGQAIDPDALQGVQRQLAKLLEALEKNGQEIGNREEVVQAAQTAKDELAKEKPSHLTLKSLLNGIADSVKSVSSIATAVEGIKLAVAALFG